MIKTSHEVPNRGGAEGARGTHNLEDVGSNPTSGIYYPTHITGRVSNVIRFGPVDALMYFVSVYPVWRRGSARGS